MKSTIASGSPLTLHDHVPAVFTCFPSEGHVADVVLFVHNRTDLVHCKVHLNNGQSWLIKSHDQYGDIVNHR